MEVSKQWLTPRELQEVYGFSISSQAKYRMNLKIPYSKIGKYIRYNRHEIDKWLQEHKVEMAS